MVFINVATIISQTRHFVNPFGQISDKFTNIFMHIVQHLLQRTSPSFDGLVYVKLLVNLYKILESLVDDSFACLKLRKEG
jgi:hypothetical protein